MISSVGLALTIKYAYIDEIKHYHIDTCYINNCVITSSECCSYKLGKSKSCSTCYYADINYTLYLLNSSYTKTGAGTVYYSDFCNQNSLNCYYDDRDISQTLRLWPKLNADGGMVGIVLLSAFIFVIIITIIIIAIIVACCPNNQSAEIIEMGNANDD